MALFPSADLCYRHQSMRADIVVVVAIALAAIASADSARSGECGGAVTCQCGDVITGRYVLPSDLGPCPGDGLSLRGDAVLDCAGHTIRGASGADRANLPAAPRPSTFGVVLDRTDGALVHDCSVTGFRYGIELREAVRSAIRGVEVFRNGDFEKRVGYGVHFSRSSENTLRDSTIRGNADEGVHVGSDSNDNTLVGNSAYDNGREDFYILSARGTHLVRNRAGGEVSATLYMKHATLSRIEENTFEERPVTVRGRSTGNVFTDNAFGGGLTFQAYADEKGSAGPTANLVRGGSLTGRRSCLAFVDATDNRVEGVRVDDCRKISSYSSGPTTNHFIEMPIERIALDLSGGANFRILERLSVDVESVGGAPVRGVRFEVTDRNGDTYEGPKGNGSGLTELMIPTHRVTAANLVTLTPVRVRVTAEGHSPSEVELADPLPSDLTIRLEPALSSKTRVAPRS